MHNLNSTSLKTLYASGMFSLELIAIILNEIENGANVCIVGGTAVGKTTLLQALCDEVADTPVVLSNNSDMFNTITRNSALLNVYTCLQTNKDWQDLLSLHLNSSEKVFAETTCVNAFTLLNKFCLIDRRLKNVFNLFIELKRASNSNIRRIEHVYKITNGRLSTVI